MLSIGSIQTSVNQFTGQGLAIWPRMACGDAVWVCFFLCLFAEEIKHFVGNRLVFQGQFIFHQEIFLMDFSQFIAKSLCDEVI